MNKTKKWALIGCGSAFGLFLLMAACVAIIADDTGSGTEEANRVEKTKEAVENEDLIKKAESVIESVDLAGAELKKVEVKQHEEKTDKLFATVIFEQNVLPEDCGNIRLNIAKYLNQVFPKVENLEEIEIKGQVKGEDKAWLRTTRVIYENARKVNEGHISSADVRNDFGDYGEDSSCRN